MNVSGNIRKLVETTNQLPFLCRAMAEYYTQRAADTRAVIDEMIIQPTESDIAIAMSSDLNVLRNAASTMITTDDGSIVAVPVSSLRAAYEGDVENVSCVKLNNGVDLTVVKLDQNVVINKVEDSFQSSRCFSSIYSDLATLGANSTVDSSKILSNLKTKCNSDYLPAKCMALLSAISGSTLNTANYVIADSAEKLDGELFSFRNYSEQTGFDLVVSAVVSIFDDIAKGVEKIYVKLTELDQLFDAIMQAAQQIIVNVTNLIFPGLFSDFVANDDYNWPGFDVPFFSCGWRRGELSNLFTMIHKGYSKVPAKPNTFCSPMMYGMGFDPSGALQRLNETKELDDAIDAILAKTGVVYWCVGPILNVLYVRNGNYIYGAYNSDYEFRTDISEMDQPMSFSEHPGSVDTDENAVKTWLSNRFWYQLDSMPIWPGAGIIDDGPDSSTPAYLARNQFINASVFSKNSSAELVESINYKNFPLNILNITGSVNDSQNVALLFFMFNMFFLISPDALSAGCSNVDIKFYPTGNPAEQPIQLGCSGVSGTLDNIFVPYYTASYTTFKYHPQTDAEKVTEVKSCLIKVLIAVAAVGATVSLKKLSKKAAVRAELMQGQYDSMLWEPKGTYTTAQLLKARKKALKAGKLSKLLGGINPMEMVKTGDPSDDAFLKIKELITG